jgi:hypothetical protein
MRATCLVRALGVGAAILSLATNSTAAACPETAGPLRAVLRDGELGEPYRACPASAVDATGRTLLVIDPEDFYGDVRGLVSLGASLSSDARELFVRVEALRYQQVISSVKADTVGLGHVTLGGNAVLTDTDDLVLGLATRLVLPTASVYERAWPIALDVGLNAETLVS